MKIEMKKFILPTISEIFGDDRLQVVKKRGAVAGATDLDKYLGTQTRSDLLTRDGKSVGEFYWTRTPRGTFTNNTMTVVYPDNSYDWHSIDDKKNGGRIVSLFPLISNDSTDGQHLEIAEDGVVEVEYGHYPQSAASKEMQEQLEQAYKEEKCKKTGNTYTTNANALSSDDNSFSPQKNEEYEFDGKKYIRLECKEDCFHTFSNGERYKEGDVVWIEVEPIKWLVDTETQKMITEKVIFTGLQYKDMEKFIDEYFSKELLQGREKIKQHTAEETKTIVEAGISGYDKINRTYNEFLRMEIEKIENTKEK